VITDTLMSFRCNHFRVSAGHVVAATREGATMRTGPSSISCSPSNAVNVATVLPVPMPADTAQRGVSMMWSMIRCW
jgi:hypothetical protein